MLKKAIGIIFITFSIIIGLYPGIYFIIDRRFGLLASKTPELLTSIYWNVGFYLHIVFAGIALLIGWSQFNTTFRNKYLVLHRKVGKIYVVSALISAVAGIGIGFFATGGLVAASGFITLGVLWFYFTLTAYTAIKSQRLLLHESMMTYSYAVCFAAVTLRLWLPLLMLLSGDFIIAYRIVAWLCWIPNLIVACWLLKQKHAVSVMS